MEVPCVEDLQASGGIKALGQFGKLGPPLCELGKANLADLLVRPSADSTWGCSGQVKAVPGPLDDCPFVVGGSAPRQGEGERCKRPNSGPPSHRQFRRGG